MMVGPENRRSLCIWYLQVVSAVVQYVCRASNETQAALHSTREHAAAEAQAELAAVVSLLNAMLAPE